MLSFVFRIVLWRKIPPFNGATSRENERKKTGAFLYYCSMNVQKLSEIIIPLKGRVLRGVFLEKRVVG